MIRSVYFAVLLVLCAACKKEEPPAPAPAPEASPASPAAEAPQATAAPAATVDVENLPVEEDFEAEAEQQVTAANLNQKLDELEKEIAAE